VKICVVEKQVYEGSKIKGTCCTAFTSGNYCWNSRFTQFTDLSALLVCLNAVVRDVVGVLDAIEKKKAA